MILGILSDTHDRLDAMKAGLSALKSAGAEYYIHCGDVGGESILDQFAGLPAAFVWGNNDFERRILARYAEQLGIRCLGVFGELELDGKLLAITHGDDPILNHRLLDSQKYDYFFQGHTHIPKDQRIGRTRLINPGALHRARPKTVAVLDLQTDDLRYIEIPLV